MSVGPDLSITHEAVRRWGTAHSPRTAELMAGLVRHLHAFARETNLTQDEWMAAVQWLTRTGKISNAMQQEFILASDVLGLSSLVVELNSRADERATPATVLGQFHLDGSPTAGFGFDMSQGLPGTPLFIVGQVIDLEERPVPLALLDVWQADADGVYEAQLPVVGGVAWMRAKYQAKEDGSYCVRTIVPGAYPIPTDGPVGDLIKQAAISAYRPAHIHFMLSARGYQKLVTHLFPAGTDHLDSDVAFGVKDALITPFAEHQPGPAPNGRTMDRPFLVAHYDFVLQPTPS
jgi:hydroxyquinol 1,2-dioxygenase